MNTVTKKKILFLITKSNWGGAQRYVFDLATCLDSNTFDVVVALGGDGTLRQKLTKAGVRTIPIAHLQRDISLLSEVRALYSIARIIRSEKPDILHVNSSKAGALGTLLGRFLRVPRIIFTAHAWAYNEDRPYWQKLIFHCIHYFTILCSHTTITVSEGLRKQMTWKGVQRKMITVHPGRHLSDIKPKQEARGIIETKVRDNQVSLSDFHTDTWIGTIAELHPTKQLHRAIDSIAALSRKHPTLRYVIIGDGQLYNRLQMRVRDLGIEKHVFFTGTIEEAGRLLKAFDIFILPSKSEAFGYVLLEAALAKVPTVATKTGGITDILTDEKTALLVTPESTVDLSAALSRLLTDTKLQETLAEANYKNAQHFSLQRMCWETISVYNNTASQK